MEIIIDERNLNFKAEDCEQFDRIVSPGEIDYLSSIVEGDWKTEVSLPGSESRQLGKLKSVHLSIDEQKHEGISLIFAKTDTEDSDEEIFSFDSGYRPGKPRSLELESANVRKQMVSRSSDDVAGYRIIITNDSSVGIRTIFSFRKDS